MFEKIKNFFQNVPLTKFLLLGYGIIILTGTFLLSLPISTRDRIFTPIEDSLFTATSATCVTGLVIHDTYTYWSLFGQLVILFLIQIGGVGFMSVAIFALTLTKQKIGLKQRFTMLESVNAPHLGGIVKMTRFILFGAIFLKLPEPCFYHSDLYRSLVRQREFTLRFSIQFRLSATQE